MGNVLSFFLSVLTTTFAQIIAVVGIFFILGYIMSWLQEKTNKLYMRAFGWKGVLFTAWLGTPIHELSHWFFCKLFRHRIEHLALFEPNKQTGGLGHVDHSYRRKSIYQNIGNFFIGAAPMIAGPIVLFYFFEWFAPISQPLPELPYASFRITDSFATIIASISLFLTAMKDLVIELFSKTHLTTWQFWVFLYICLCVASHMAPSTYDQKNMWRGFFYILGLLCVVNAATLLIGASAAGATAWLQNLTGQFIGIYLFALLISLGHFATAFLLLGPFQKAR